MYRYVPIIFRVLYVGPGARLAASLDGRGGNVTFGVYLGLADLLMVILLWVLFTKCHLR